ncbi:MAG: asparagine synthase (glutamine-hydrolyzing) [Cyclobacteriaceae bacterium]
MCRIVGRVSRENESDFGEGLKSMLAAVAHGGPDDEGTYIDGGVALGHRRLAIIDLSKTGHQPMMAASSDIIISFNGEIYNYLEIRRELENVGLLFRTKSDTEVILAAYQHWGVKTFDRLEGIFAFAIYDKRKELFFLVRDHFGVKPLYYFIDGEELIFSSEVRAFKALRTNWKENADWQVLFLAFGSIPHPYSTLSQVVQLAPGSYLKLDLKNFTSDIQFYFKSNGYDYTVNSVHDALAQMQFAMQKSLQKNLISDAPLGVFLSGGIDSSLLALLADQFLSSVRTLSVNFDDSHFDEHTFQQLVLEKTKNVEHTSHRVTEHMFWEYLEDIWKAMDQPSIDAVNAYFVTRFAKAEGIKSVLSGLGADEIFGGYASFRRIKWMRLLRQFPNKKRMGVLLSRLKKSWGRLVYLTLPGAIGDYLFLRGIHTPNQISSILKIPETKIWEVLSKVPFDVPFKMNDIEYASFLESKIYMTNQLLKDTDYMGMWHGVEVRVPFLDIELLKKVRTIPPSIRYNDKWPKYLLTASNEHILPRKIVFRKKKGFTFPFSLWMERSSKRFRALMPAGAEVDLLFEQFKGKHCHWSKCWSLAVLKQFTNN